jgi:ribosomal protein L37AE/L43A
MQCRTCGRPVFSRVRQGGMWQFCCEHCTSLHVRASVTQALRQVAEFSVSVTLQHPS